MVFLLSSSNIFDYLCEQGLLNPSETHLSNFELIEAKNFNLLVTLSDNSKLLVKQERYYRDGEAMGEFVGEWRIQSLISQFPQLAYLQTFLPEILHFDANNSILVLRYLEDYQDLSNFYQKEKTFPPLIASAIGTALGRIHRDTFQCQVYQDFLLQQKNNLSEYQILNLIAELERITPEIFGVVPADGLKFFALYQKYDSLGKSINELGQAFVPSCLTHNDLKLNNILLHNNWSVSSEEIIRFIDLERANWGDPAYDLGMIIASYLLMWLSSLIINKSIIL